MDKKLINRLAVTIEKINYLYRNIRKRDENMQKLELALLKKYVTELYDGLVEVELDIKQESTGSDIQHPLEQRAQQLKTQIQQEVEEVFLNETEVKEEPENEITIEPETDNSSQTVQHTEKQEVNEISNQIPVSTVEEEEKELHIEAAPVNIVSHNYFTDDEDETDDVAATAYLNTNYQHESYQHDEVENIEDEEVIVDGDGSVKTQILTDFQKSQILLRENEDEDSTEETVAMELNDVLGKKHKDSNHSDKFISKSGDEVFAIGIGQRNTYINHLFGGDEEAYTHAIDDLAASQGYIEALTYVNLNLRYDYKWNDHDPIVREFLDIIKASFMNR